jgi:hypothetical protein
MASFQHSNGSAGTARMPVVEEIAFILLPGRPIRIVIIPTISRLQATPVHALPATSPAEPSLYIVMRAQQTVSQQLEHDSGELVIFI